MLQREGGSGQRQIDCRILSRPGRTLERVPVARRILEDKLDLRIPRSSAGQVEDLQRNPFHTLPLEGNLPTLQQQFLHNGFGRGPPLFRGGLPGGGKTLQLSEIPDTTAVLFQVELPPVYGYQLKALPTQQKVEPLRRDRYGISRDQVATSEPRRVFQPHTFQEQGTAGQFDFFNGEVLLEVRGNEAGQLGCGECCSKVDLQGDDDKQDDAENRGDGKRQKLGRFFQVVFSPDVSHAFSSFAARTLP